MKPKFFITTTIPLTWIFFKGQPRLWKNEFEVCAISSEGKEFDPFVKDEGIKKHVIPMKRNISILHDIWSLMLFILFFLKERPMIVHGNTPKAAMLSMVAAWLTNRPVRIYMCHGLRYQTTQGKLRKLLMAMERLTCNCSTRVFGVSEGVCKQLVADGLCKEGKIKMVGYGTAGGVDVEYFSRDKISEKPDVRKQLQIQPDAFVFCFVGRIVGDKGVNELVAAFEQLSQVFPKLHLLLVGPEEGDLNPVTEETKAIISTNKHIHAVGFVSDVRPWLAASNAFVLPSYREGVGIGLLEANAMGVPCIASDIIGCNDVVKAGVNGELVAPKDTEALYLRMREWVEQPEKVKAMAIQCRNYIINRFSAEYVRNAYYEEYLTL